MFQGSANELKAFYFDGKDDGYLALRKESESRLSMTTSELTLSIDNLPGLALDWWKKDKRIIGFTVQWLQNDKIMEFHAACGSFLLMSLRAKGFATLAAVGLLVLTAALLAGAVLGSQQLMVEQGRAERAFVAKAEAWTSVQALLTGIQESWNADEQSLDSWWVGNAGLFRRISSSRRSPHGST